MSFKINWATLEIQTDRIKPKEKCSPRKIKNSNETRFEQMKRCCPIILTQAKALLGHDKILYIGASKNRTSFLDCLHPRYTTVLEVYKPNIEALQNKAGFQNFTYVHGNVKDVCYYFDPKSFDISLWYHGPEHFYYDAVPNVLEKLETITKKLIILACPWGIYPQGEHDGNIHEMHLSALYSEDFHKWGYKTDILGEKDTVGSNILAWKYLEE